MKDSVKREQRQVVLHFAESENSRATLKKKILFILALICAVGQGAKAQANWDAVYAMTNTTSADWTQLNAGSTTGQAIGAAGTTTYYYADTNLTFSNSTVSGSGLTIQGTVYFH